MTTGNLALLQLSGPLISNQPITALRLTSPALPCTYGTFCLQYKNKPMAAPTATRTAMTIPAMAPSERPSRDPSSGTPEHWVNNGEVNYSVLLHHPASFLLRGRGCGRALPLTDRLCVTWPLSPVTALWASQVYVPVFL